LAVVERRLVAVGAANGAGVRVLCPGSDDLWQDRCRSADPDMRLNTVGRSPAGVELNVFALCGECARLCIAVATPLQVSGVLWCGL
jgi:hypothetical protein